MTENDFVWISSVFTVCYLCGENVRKRLRTERGKGGRGRELEKEREEREGRCFISFYFEFVLMVCHVALHNVTHIYF